MITVVRKQPHGSTANQACPSFKASWYLSFRGRTASGPDVTQIGSQATPQHLAWLQESSLWSFLRSSAPLGRACSSETRLPWSRSRSPRSGPWRLALQSTVWSRPSIKRLSLAARCIPVGWPKPCLRMRSQPVGQSLRASRPVLALCIRLCRFGTFIVTFPQSDGETL